MFYNYKTMSVFPCGKSMETNATYQLYCKPSKRPSRAESRFIGLYTDKQVRYVAAIATVVNGVWVPNNFVVNFAEKGCLTEEEADRIKKASQVFDRCFENFSRVRQRFYLFDELHPTRFDKSSKYGLWGPRNLVLSRWLRRANTEQYSAADVAAALNGEEWE